MVMSLGMACLSSLLWSGQLDRRGCIHTKVMRESSPSTAFEFYWILDLEELYSREGQMTSHAGPPNPQDTLKFKNVSACDRETNE